MTMDTLRDVTHVFENLNPEQTQTLDRWARQTQGWLNTFVEQAGPAGRRAKNWLNGIWLEHPLHPALTDVPVGAWAAGAILDMVGAKREADAAVTIGVLGSVPTALAGAADWSDTADEQRRIGFVHALLNVGALLCMIASLFLRRAGQRAAGIGMSTAGLTLATFSAWLGGQLVYAKGTGVSRNVFAPLVEEFQAVISEDSLPPGQLVGAELSVNGSKLPLVLLKKGSEVLALSGVCSHWGGPLAEGKLVEDDCVQCPWHGSQFSLRDGRVRQGPAAVGAPVFETRIRNGMVEVRRTK